MTYNTIRPDSKRSWTSNYAFSALAWTSLPRSGPPACCCWLHQPQEHAVVSVPKVDNEGERWTCADLAAYVQTRGVKLFNLGNLGTRGNRDVTEIVFFVDDEAALAQDGFTGCDALAEKEAGTGTILFIRYRSAEFAKQQIRPANESGFFWGRFFVGVLDPQPKGSKTESFDERSKKLVQRIREALGT